MSVGSMEILKEYANLFVPHLSSLLLLNPDILELSLYFDFVELIY